MKFRFNAARGFVCGASGITIFVNECGQAVSMPHAALFVVQEVEKDPGQKRGVVSMPHAALFVVQGYVIVEDNGNVLAFQCRTRLCLWCKCNRWKCNGLMICFNAARGFVCGASKLIAPIRSHDTVSMPHAALFVVQGVTGSTPTEVITGFNAARGFVCGARTP